MTWLTWRQHRLQLLAGVLVLGVVGAFLLVTGVGMVSTFHDSGLAACFAATPSGCSDLASSWSSQYSGYQFVIPLFLVLPGLIGVFWGSPLISREIEQGTHRMIWMQSVSRARWLAVKILAFAATVVAGSTLLTLALEWWSGPLITASNDERFNPGIFDLLGIVPAAYAIFAFALGVVAGVLIRRAVPAMGATLMTFAVVRVGVEFFLRPHYQPAVTDNYSLTFAAKATQQSDMPGTWLISAQTIDRSGHVVGTGRGIDFNRIVSDCPNLAAPGGGIAPDPGNIQACIHSAGVHVVATFQPASRYWLFQGIEAAIFLGLAGALIVVAFWWVRRRTT
jgi:hypothetical protein